MPEQILTPWLFRRWRFDSPTQLYPAVLERLRGTPARCEELARSVATETLTRSVDGGWTIQRHIAHIADLERLIHQRLDAYERGEHELPTADMGNARTVETDHEARAIDDVLAAVRAERGKTIDRLEAYPRDFFGRSAWHGRLGVQKRVVDTCQFFADHDDHHLALARTVLRAIEA